MPCPRCGGDLVTFAIEGASATAVVCETCGYADTPASHRPEGADPESWEEAIARVGDSPRRDRVSRTVRLEGGPKPPTASETDDPTDGADAAIDPDRLEETVTVTPSSRARRRGDGSSGEESTGSSE